MRLLSLATCLALAMLPAMGQTVDKKACQADYIRTVTTCAGGLGALAPAARVGVQKACVAGAQSKRTACLSGKVVSTCQDTCKATFDNQVKNCETTYVPETTCTPPIPASKCYQQVSQTKASCILATANALSACVNACSTD